MNQEINLAPTSVQLDKDYDADLDLLMSLVPDKMAFKIGEVSQMLGLKNYILRYWEQEFNELKPKKSKHNQRMYTRREIELLILIRKFLYVDKFSVSGARKALRDWQKSKKSSPSYDAFNAKVIRETTSSLEVLIAKIGKLKADLV